MRPNLMLDEDRPETVRLTEAQARAVAMEVSLVAGHYRGSASIKQSDFGIAPIRIAGGTVKVKDELKIFPFRIDPASMLTQ